MPQFASNHVAHFNHFQYHPHHHGSTAVQVGGGAAGAIIVEANEFEIPSFPVMYSDLRCIFHKVRPPLYCLYLAFTAGSEGPLGPGESGSESPQPAASAAGERVYFIDFYVLCFGGRISLKLPFMAMLVLCIVSILLWSA